MRARRSRAACRGRQGEAAPTTRKLVPPRRWAHDDPNPVAKEAIERAKRAAQRRDERRWANRRRTSNAANPAKLQPSPGATTGTIATAGSGLLRATGSPSGDAPMRTLTRTATRDGFDVMADDDAAGADGNTTVITRIMQPTPPPPTSAKCL